MSGDKKKFCEGCCCVRPAKEFLKVKNSSPDLCFACRRDSENGGGNVYRMIATAAEKYLELELSIERIRAEAEKEAKVYQDAAVLVQNKAKKAAEDFNFIVRNVKFSQSELLHSIQAVIAKKRVTLPDSGMIIKGGVLHSKKSKIVISFTPESKKDSIKLHLKDSKNG